MKEVIFQNKYFIHLLFVMSVFIILIALSAEFFFAPKIDKEVYSEYEGKWEVYYNGKKYFADNIEKFHFPNAVKPGDVILLRSLLPENLNNGSSMSMLVSLSGIRVFVNGHQVYSNGMEYVRRHKIAPSCHHFIPLPDHSGGKPLMIEIRPSEVNAFTNIGNIRLLRSDLAYYILASTKRGTLFVGIFLIVLGIISFSVGVVVSVYKRTVNPVLHIGVLSFCVGIWSLCYDNLLQLFSTDLVFITLVEYYTLYSAIIPALFLVRFFLINEKSSKGSRREMNALIILSILFLITAITLSVNNVIHVPSMLPYFHLMVLVMMTAIFFAIRRTRKSIHLDRIIMQFGMVELCVIVVIDLLRFNIQKYLIANDASLGLPITPYGTLIFVIILFSSYIVRSYSDMSAKVAAKTEKEVLLKMAYNDRMTGLFNRAMAEEIMEGLGGDENNYCMISIDLNGLKTVNDSFGHQKGDLLITVFSNLLKESFDSVGNVFRMGGDEFLVLVFEENWSEIDTAIERMRKLSSEKSEKFDMTISASYGIAKNTEAGLDNSEEVYKCADGRMYEMKASEKSRCR